MNRSEILAEAGRLVTGDRAQAYGPAEVSFNRIADLWSVYLDLEVTAVDVAHMMTLLKISRSKGDPAGVDNWIDIAGYAALGGELAAIEDEEGLDPVDVDGFDRMCEEMKIPANQRHRAWTDWLAC